MCRGGHIASVLIKYGYQVEGNDIVNRGFKNTKIKNFLDSMDDINKDIITNPPYKNVIDFWTNSCKRITEGHKVAMFLKLTFLEGKERGKMFKKFPPTRIYVFSGRVAPAMNGDFDKYPSSAIAYAWFVYDKGFIGNPSVFWI